MAWATGRQRELLKAYGEVTWWDGKWGGSNNLQWPLIAPAIVDQEYCVRAVAYAFVCSESNDGYRYGSAERIHITRQY